MDTTCWREGIQILDYTEGQRYREHFDVATNPNNSCYHRDISIVLYLSEDFEEDIQYFRIKNINQNLDMHYFFHQIGVFLINQNQ